jgi:hydroxymethylglutaryl-CoA lyase
MGCYEVSLGDTTGVGVPMDVRSLLEHLQWADVPVEKLAGHFHDTYGQAMANVWAAYDMGMRVFDSSVAGLGGCPFAPGAKGNLATEDLVYSLSQAGIETGVDLRLLVETGEWISRELSTANNSRAGNAMAAKTSSRVSMANKVTVSSLPWTLDSKTEGLEMFRSGTNLKVVLNRPRNGNALTASMIQALTALFESSARDPTITRIALTANGKFFCTGMDLGRENSPVAKGGSVTVAQYDRLKRLFDCIDNAPQVTIACVQGPAFGGGVGLAFACDIRLFAASATVTMSEVKLGLAPATISKYVVREWGHAFAREAMLSARTISAQELRSLGKITAVINETSSSAIPAALDGYLAALRHNAPQASTMAKKLIQLAGGRHGSGETQDEGIRKVFSNMMMPGGESSRGLAEFQAGNKAFDWDAYNISKPGERAKAML